MLELADPDVDRAYEDIRVLAVDIGIRPAGTADERGRDGPDSQSNRSCRAFARHRQRLQHGLCARPVIPGVLSRDVPAP